MLYQCKNIDYCILVKQCGALVQYTYDNLQLKANIMLVYIAFMLMSIICVYYDAKKNSVLDCIYMYIQVEYYTTI